MGTLDAPHTSKLGALAADVATSMSGLELTAVIVHATSDTAQTGIEFISGACGRASGMSIYAITHVRPANHHCTQHHVCSPECGSVLAQAHGRHKCLDTEYMALSAGRLLTIRGANCDLRSMYGVSRYCQGSLCCWYFVTAEMVRILTLQGLPGLQGRRLASTSPLWLAHPHHPERLCTPANSPSRRGAKSNFADFSCGKCLLLPARVSSSRNSAGWGSLRRQTPGKPSRDQRAQK